MKIRELFSDNAAVAAAASQRNEELRQLAPLNFIFIFHLPSSMALLESGDQSMDKRERERRGIWKKKYGTGYKR